MIKIHVFHCGSVIVDKCVPTRKLSKRRNAYTSLFRSKKNRVKLPVSAYLIETKKGKILFDTGWHEDVRKHPIKHESFPLWFASKPELPEGKSVKEQLAKLNIKSTDLDYVILSHLDIDHASGLKLVSDAKSIYASQDELDDASKFKMRYFNKNLWKGTNISPIPFNIDESAPYNYSWDIFNDGSVIVYLVRGHSKGSVVIKVTENDKFVILIGDSGYKKESYENLELPGPTYNDLEMIESLKWIRNLSENKNCIKVIANHDPKIEEGIINL